MPSSSSTGPAEHRSHSVRYGASLLLLLAACSDPASRPAAGQPTDSGADQSPPQAGPPDGGTSTDVSVNPPPGGDGGTDGGTVGGDAASAWKGIGLVRWTQSETPVRSSVGFGFATGSRLTNQDGGRCSGLTRVGSCCLERATTCTATRDGTVDCSGGNGGMGPPAPAPVPPPDPADVCGRFTGSVDVGTIAVLTNGQEIGRGVFDPLVGYRFMPTANPFSWKAGDQLGAKVPGAPCFPKFEGTLPAVAPLDIKLPTMVRVNDGFTVSWTPDPNGEKVWLSLSGSTAGNGMAIVMCEAEDAAGTLAVDRSLTSVLLPSDIVGGLSATRFSEREVAPDMRFMSQFDVISVANLR